MKHILYTNANSLYIEQPLLYSEYQVNPANPVEKGYTSAYPGEMGGIPGFSLTYQGYMVLGGSLT